MSREGTGTPLQYSCLETPMDGGAWWAAVRGVTKSQTRLSDFTFTFHFHALEKEMATHSSVLAWRIPGMGEPGGLPSMELHRVGHNWRDLAAGKNIVVLSMCVWYEQWNCPHSCRQASPNYFAFRAGSWLMLLLEGWFILMILMAGLLRLEE